MKSLLFKDIRLYGRHFLAILLSFALLTLGCAAALIGVSEAAENKREKVTIALYDSDPAAVSRAAISVISNTDAVKGMFDVKTCQSEDEAYEGVKNGTYAAALIFAKNYFSGILSGDGDAVKLLISDSFASAADIVKHFAKTGEELIKVAEYGVMSAEEPLKASFGNTEANSRLRDMEIKYALNLLSIPESAYEVVKTEYSAIGKDTIGHFVICFTVFLMFLTEALFFGYTSSDLAPKMLRRIKSYGISYTAILLEKTLFPFVLRTFLLAAAMAFMGTFSIPALLLALPCLALISIIATSLSALLSQNSLGISVIFALSSLGLFLSGGLLPRTILPHAITRFGYYTPFGLAARSISSAFGGKTSVLAFFVLVIVTAILFILARFYVEQLCIKGGAKK